MSFENLNVPEEIVKGLTEDGITVPTSIQEQAIPAALEGRDIIGISRTGSGKTAAFGIPLLARVQPGKGGVQALVLAPTRELAVQIAKELKKFGKHKRPFISTIYGGVAIGPQINEMRRADIIVATPGRLLDHLQQGNVKLSQVMCFVLDEADKMVEMGFIEDIEKILSQTPKDKQMLLFGATISHEINDIKRNYLRDPVTVEAELRVQEDLLKQYYYNVKPQEKFSLLVHLIKKEEIKQAIVFCSARTTVDVVAKNLRKQGIEAEQIHGKMSQNKRLKVIEQFNKGKQEILVASAVAARGLHINDVSHVFNFDLSKDPQEYIHRVGRTARAGNSGKAITLLSHRDYDAFSDIQRRYNVDIKELPREPFEQVAFQARPQRGRFSRDGGRNFHGRGNGRGFSRGHGRSEGRGHGRSFGRNEGRSHGRSFDRSEGRSSGFSRENRSEPRSESGSERFQESAPKFGSN
jgi:superfamily II DNA/RNA helicase